MINFFKKIDILAPEIKLRVDGDSSVKTYLGATLSTAYVSLVLYVVFVQVRGYLDVSSPLVNISTGFTDKFGPIDLGKAKQFPMLFFYVGSDNIRYEDIPQYFSFRFYILTTTLNDNGDESYKPVIVKPVSCEALNNQSLLHPDYLNGLGGLKSALSHAIYSLAGVTHYILKGRGGAALRGKWEAQPQRTQNSQRIFWLLHFNRQENAK